MNPPLITSSVMNFFKKLLRQEEPRPIELAPSTAKEIMTRLKQAAELRLSQQCELALVACNDVLLLHPTSHLAYQIRALTKYDMGDQDGAIRDWNRFKSLQKFLK
ncbi:hypothetical protein [Spirosoma flavum]|uniref:Uncharacterized protein n=1 Tax=Spirosoma flavum TaxID=2048557 RepID=A0ABW6AIQ7_9BACT